MLKKLVLIGALLVNSGCATWYHTMGNGYVIDQAIAAKERDKYTYFSDTSYGKTALEWKAKTPKRDLEKWDKSVDADKVIVVNSPKY